MTPAALITLTGDTELIGRRARKPAHKPAKKSFFKKPIFKKALKIAPWVVAPGAAAAILATKKIQEAAKRKREHNARIAKERQMQRAQAAARALEEQKRKKALAEAAAAAARSRSAAPGAPAPAAPVYNITTPGQAPARESAEEPEATEPEATEPEATEPEAAPQEENQDSIPEPEAEQSEDQATAGLYGIIARKNLPAKVKSFLPALPPAPPKQSVITKATAWAKANPIPATGLAAAAVFLAWNLTKKKR
jgi:hypothetical protein